MDNNKGLQRRQRRSQSQRQTSCSSHSTMSSHLASLLALMSIVSCTLSDSPNANTITGRQREGGSITGRQREGGSDRRSLGSLGSLGSSRSSGSLGALGSSRALGASGGSCQQQFQGQDISFDNCVTLDSGTGNFLLAWTQHKTEGVTSVWFQGVPEQAYGWASWGISKDGKMVGSDVAVAYANKDNTAQVKAHTFHLESLAPTSFVKDPSSGLLLASRTDSLAATCTGAGMVVRIYGNFTGLNGTSTVIWQGGPPVADYAGDMLSVHNDRSPKATTVNWDTGKTANATAVTPTAVKGNFTAGAISHNCTKQFRGKLMRFDFCTPLDSSNSFRLAWTAHPQQRVVTVWFFGTPEMPYGWAGWGVNPTAKMYNASVVLGYSDPNEHRRLSASSFFLAGINPSSFNPYGFIQDPPLKKGRLAVHPGSPLQVEYVWNGNVHSAWGSMKLLGNFTGLLSGPVNVIWQGGSPVTSFDPVVLSSHIDRSQKNLTINFIKGTAANTSVAGGSVSTGGSCSKQFQGQTLSFASCATLDSASNFHLAWTQHKAEGVTSVWFQGVPEQAYGWASWGISKDGKMVGSDVVVAYANKDNTAQAKAHRFHLGGLDPSSFGKDPSSGLLLTSATSTLAVEYTSAGNVARVSGNFTGLSGSSLVIWQGGPVVADYAGDTLSVHDDKSVKTFSVNWDTGSASSDTGVASTTNYQQKLAHAWLSGLGFGVFMPCGILIARHIKIWMDPCWFYTHIGVQFAGYLLGLTGWGIGIWLSLQYPGGMSAGNVFASTSQYPHYVIGVTIFCIATVQILTPIFKPHKGTPIRLYWNLVHWSFGYSTVILSIANIFLGFNILSAEGVSSHGWEIGYIVVIAAWAALMICLEPLSWYMYFMHSGEEDDDRSHDEYDEDDEDEEKPHKAHHEDEEDEEDEADGGGHHYDDDDEENDEENGKEEDDDFDDQQHQRR